jgi:hypothetical protein
MNNDNDFMGFIISAIILAICAFGVYFFERASCSAKFPEMETRYSLFGGCQVHSAQGWIPAANFRVN